ncbi:hypothetical protein CBS147331_985 [Penicillium roqueforti]|nr:hypothetical protein CBS147331_985 [Penicillium roqueforti]
MWTGWITISLGVGSMSLLGLQSSRSLQFGLQVPGGIGVGILYTIIAIPLQATMHVDDVGLAVGTLVFFRLTGQIIGLAISAAIFSNTYTTRASRWENLPAIAEQFRDGSAAVYAIGKLSSLDGYPLVKDKILETYAVSLHYVWIALAVLAPVGLLTSLFIGYPVVFNDSHQAWANSKGTTLLETLKTLSQAVKDLQKRADTQEQDIQDTNKSLKDTQKHLEDIQKNLEDTQIDLEEAQKALIKYERTFDAYTIEVQSIVLDKWAGKSISNTRRSQRNAAAHGGSILADYDVILREVD